MDVLDNHTNVKSAENQHAEMFLRAGIIVGKIKAGVELDLPSARALVEMREKLQNYRKMPLLIDITGLRKISKQARDFLASEEGVRYLSAGVLLVDGSLFTVTLANIFFRLSRPSIPSRMYRNRAHAIRWLLAYQ